MNQYIDHTLLRANATEREIIALCHEAKEHHFATVCINPSWITVAKKELMESGVKICTVIGFPLGSNTVESKVFETTNAISLGAQEIDMVIHIGQAKMGNFEYIQNEIVQIVKAAGSIPVKVIMESCLLSDEEIIAVCKVAITAKAAFVKSSTGFSTGGATEAAIKLMKQIVGDKLEVKASGGIRNREDLAIMLAAGATRIGTSAGVALMHNDKSSSASY